MVDINPRPQKRLRTDPNLVDSPETASDPHCPSALLSSASVPLSRPPLSPGLKPLPPHVLLLALPALLLHPPTHEQYALSLFLSLKSIRLCLQLPALAPDVECYAWTALAEVGMRAIRSGFCKTGEHDWTMGLEEEHPILRHLRHHLSLLNAHFAFWRSNTRFPRAVLRRLISTFVPSDPPTIVYAAHLALITQLTSSPPASPFSHGKGADSSVSIQPHTNPPEVQAALTALINLSAIAAQNQHFSMLKLVAVLRLRVLVAAEMWDMVGDALEGAEKLLSLYLDTVVAHTRTHGFFSEYAPRITLHYAHLAHGLGDTHRAGTCYRVAAYVAGAGPVGAADANTGGFVAAAARAGEALLRIGLVAKRAAPNMASDSPVVMGEESHAPYLDESTIALTKDAIARCSASASAPLPALAELLSAALSPSQIIRSKSLLKHALALSGSAGDNHMRALVLAVVGAQYVHTAPEHAMEVLAVCETLGAGMGASEKKPAGTESEPSVCGVGNAALRLWVGERFLELFKRAGKEKRVQKQGEFNALYRSAVDVVRMGN
ncbi:hypothetical protein M404DRAFT_153759 [Pisolithus tinctorius Marx 270]|uniref:Uncharacterized protein n=1 Tax=Pisolithus tinctorius Marx 270 TaxID=870435 RepID=A0A0C3JR11_PISTI|nr:hypothetical protein M404DRAFT_153759 [Pisolithus tinctorius Marx 270]